MFQYLRGKEARLVSFAPRDGNVKSFPQPADENWTNPVYSSDGQWIAIGVSALDERGLVHQGSFRIDVMRPDGTGRHNVVPADGRAGAPFAFAPDCRRLLFTKGRVRDTGRPVDFNLYEVDLRTMGVSEVVVGRFYQLSAAAYYGARYAFVGDSPTSYLDGAPPAPREYVADADAEAKMKWEMAKNSMLYVAAARPPKLEPFVRFLNGGARWLPWQQDREIENLAVSSRPKRLFVAMRHSDYPADKKITHYARDIFEVGQDRFLHRVTHFNTIQFYGFAVTPDGHYLAVVPDTTDDPGAKPGMIYRIDTSTGAMTAYLPDLSSILPPR